MAFKKRKHNRVTLDSPQALFRDLRNRKVAGLLDHQSTMLTQYMEQGLDEKDVALELPTGSGKTLIGLLIAEFRRQTNKEQVIYLCPTKQLAHQVVEQSKIKYGIKTYAFTGSKKYFDQQAIAEFTSGNTIAVTTYSALFNINPFFKTPDIIILDDAHSAENYIASNWSLEIDRFEFQELYLTLLEITKGAIEGNIYQRLLSDEPSSNDEQWVGKIPFSKAYELFDQIVPAISVATQDTDLYYSWSNIQDYLHACNIFLSRRKILIRPTIPPTLTHYPFSNAIQRIYMSATLGLSGELERITGIGKIKRLPIPSGWDRQGLGRRLFFFPDASLPDEKMGDFIVEMAKEVPRTLIIVPDKPTVETLNEEFAKTSKLKIFSSDDIEKSKSDFVTTEGAVAILANRYDGIDLANDECRLLIIGGLPRATHLQERFLIHRMAASVLFHERIRTRLIQAVGRCTRSPVDYSAVCIIGQELIDELVPPKKIKYFHPELQAEIFFGHDQSKEMAGIDEFKENLRIFLGRGDDWNDAEAEILSDRNKREMAQSETFEKLLTIAQHEVNYQYALWQKDYQRAIAEIDKALEHLFGNDLLGYRGYWFYLKANVAFLASKEGHSAFESVYPGLYQKAANCTLSVSWLRNLYTTADSSQIQNQENALLSDLVEGIESAIERMGISNDRKFEKAALGILEGINSGDGKRFEISHSQLGKLIGYEVVVPEGNAVPDPIWIVGKKICFVFEDKIFENPEKELSVANITQAGRHKKWVESEVAGLSSDCEVTTVVISNTSNIKSDAITYSEGISFWSFEEFKQWAIRGIDIVRKLRKSYSGPGNIVWRSDAISALKQESLTPEVLQSKLESSPLSSLNVIE